MITIHKASTIGSSTTWYDIYKDGVKVAYIKGNPKIGYIAYDTENNMLDSSPRYRILRSNVVSRFSER
jgi:hypothetical protein